MTDIEGFLTIYGHSDNLLTKEFEFEFDDEIFDESNCGTNIVEETYKPKQCDPEVSLKGAFNLSCVNSINSLC